MGVCSQATLESLFKAGRAKKGGVFDTFLPVWIIWIMGPDSAAAKKGSVLLTPPSAGCPGSKGEKSFFKQPPLLLCCKFCFFLLRQQFWPTPFLLAPFHFLCASSHDAKFEKRTIKTQINSFFSQQVQQVAKRRRKGICFMASPPF